MTFCLAVAVHVQNVHVGTGRTDLLRMKLPRPAIQLLGLLVPAVRRDDVVAAVTVDVAAAQAVIELGGTGSAPGHLAADRNALPRLRQVLARLKVAEFAGTVARCLRAHDQHALAGLEQVYVDRRFVAATGRKEVLFPEPVLPSLWPLARHGVFVPVARFAGIRDDDDVGIAVAVYVVGVYTHGLGVSQHIVICLAFLAQRMHLPVGGFVPDVADDDVGLAVLVDVGDSDAVGAKDLVHDGLLPGNLEGFADPLTPAPLPRSGGEGLG